MKARIPALLILAAAFAVAAGAAEVSGPAQQEDQALIAAHLPKGGIQVTTDYHGERLLIYGTVCPECDVIVKLSSPRTAVTYSQKGRVGIFWFTVGKVNFENVPWMFKIKSTRPLDEILPVEDQLRHRVGKRGLLASMVDRSADPSPAFMEEMIQNRISDQLYSFHEGEVKRIKGTMFETSFFWPPKAPAGDYHVDTLAVRDGKVVGFDSEIVKVEKVGLEAWISGLAVEHGLMYGLVAVVVAMASGLVVGLIFRGIGPGRKRASHAVH